MSSNKKSSMSDDTRIRVEKKFNIVFDEKESSNENNLNDKTTILTKDTTQPNLDFEFESTGKFNPNDKTVVQINNDHLFEKSEIDKDKTADLPNMLKLDQNAGEEKTKETMVEINSRNINFESSGPIEFERTIVAPKKPELPSTPVNIIAKNDDDFTMSALKKMSEKFKPRTTPDTKILGGTETIQEFDEFRPVEEAKIENNTNDWQDPGEKTQIINEKTNLNLNPNPTTQTVDIYRTRPLEEMTQVQGVLKDLRMEREVLLKKIVEIEKDFNRVYQENLGFRTHIEELTIQMEILKKRHLIDLEDYKLNFNANEDRRVLAEEKMKIQAIKLKKLEDQVENEVLKYKSSERDLENHIEMQKLDYEGKIEIRDKKIIELQRTIALMEGNLLMITKKDQRLYQDKVFLEEKLGRVISSMKVSLATLEQEYQDREDNMFPDNTVELKIAK